MIAYDPTQLNTTDVQQAYDLLCQHEVAQGRSETATQKATEQLQEELTKSGYSKAQFIDAFLNNHQTKKANGRAQETTSATASSAAAAIFAAITGQTVGQAIIAATGIDADSDDDHGQPSVGEPLDLSAPLLSPGGLEAVRKAPANIIANLDQLLSEGTAEKFTSFSLFDRAFGAIEAQSQKLRIAAKAARSKLALHEASQHDDAVAIEVPEITTFTPSGLADAKIAARPVSMINGMLELLTSDKKFTVQSLLKGVKAGEEMIVADTKAYRQILAQIRKAAPQATSTQQASNPATELPPYSIVAKSANDLFKDKTFGIKHSMLAFETPTIEWHDDKPKIVPDVDPTFRFPNEVLVTSLDAIVENQIVWLYGESGCGKSEFWCQVAARLSLPFTRINLDGQITRSELLGRVVLRPGPNNSVITEFADGVLVRALQHPGIILLDEFDCCDPELTPVLQPLLEGNGIRVLEKNGELVHKHPNCHIMITANTNGMGSESGAYNNVYEQSAATRNRCLKWVEMPYLPASEEIKVVMERTPNADSDFVKKFTQFAEHARQAFRQGKSASIVSTRNVQAAVKMYTKFLPRNDNNATETRDLVMRTTVLNAADKKSRLVLEAILGQVFV